MSTIANIHVGDVGTLYKAEIRDAGAAFDLTNVSTKKLVFKTPSGTIERTATVTSTGTGLKKKWYLTYIVLSSDITDGLHQEAGTYHWQGHITMTDGSEYHTSIETYKVDGNLD